MPKITLTVPETHESITRPVVFDIARQIMKFTGMPESTTISYPGSIERVLQPGSAITGKTNDPIISGFTNKLIIEVEENYEKDRILNSAVYRPENLFIFRDLKLQTTIKPTYTATEVTLNFRFRASDKTTANRWRDDMKNRISMMRDIQEHNVTYHYLIPLEFLVILKEIHRLREAVAGYGENYETYFNNNVTTHASLITNLAGQSGQWGISETQARIIGYFDFDGIPEEGTAEDGSAVWTIGFNYKFRYNKPIACVMMYPLMIHNQVIKYRPATTDSPPNHLQSHGFTTAALSMFEKGNRLEYDQRQGYAIPAYDEFLPGSVVPHSLRVITALVSLDDEQPNFLLSLKDLGTRKIHPAVQTFLEGEIAYLTKPRFSVFAIHLYRNIDLTGNDALMVDEDLNVFSTETLSKRDYHHVRLSLTKDWTQLHPAALDRIREHGIALQLILDAIDPTLNNKDLIPPILSGDYVRKEDLQKAIDEMNRRKLKEGDGQIRQFNTVQTLIIEAWRQ